MEPSPLMQIDHTVINTRFDLDGAQQVFGNLGFSLTERGHHSLGSSNHLMMFGSDYLELIGLPPGKEHSRPEIAEAPLGINALVIKTVDVDATHAHLRAIGLAGNPPKAFTRPVTLPGGEFPASFKTVEVNSGVFPGGRVYFCEHGTPDLVWRPEWQSHPNGVSAIRKFVVVSTAFEQEAGQFAKLLNSEVSEDSGGVGVPLSGAQISLMPPSSYKERYGNLASPLAGRSSFFGALVLQTGGLAAVRNVIAGSSLPLTTLDQPARVVIREPSFDCLLEFVE